MEELKQQLNRISPLTDEAWEALAEGLELKSYKRKEYITEKGAIEKYIYLVKSGIQRGYYIKDDKEITIVFTHSYSFSGIPESLYRKEPSRYYLETLTPSELYRIRYSFLQELCDDHPSIDRLMHTALMDGFTGVLERLFELQALNVEERFLSFMKRSAYLINEIPHKYIASYLNMSPTTFSRLLHEVNY